MMNSKRNRQQLAILAFALVIILGSLVFGQENEIRPLLSNQTIEREMTGAETHRYKFELKKDEFFQVRVEQKGVDVALKLLDADSKTLATMDSPNGKEGFETLTWVASKDGSFILEVISPNEKAEKGNYNIKREGSRTATEKDKRRVEVEKIFAEGIKAQDLKQTEVALEKLKAALAGLEELKDDYLKELMAFTLFVKRVNQIIPILNEGQKFLNLLTTDGNIKAEAKFLEALQLSKTLYRESEDGKLFSNLSQTGYGKADWQFLIKNNEINSLGWLGNFYRVTGDSQQSLNYNISELKLIREVLSNKDFISSKAFGQLGEFIRFAESNTAFSIASLLASDLDKPQDALNYINQAIVVSQQIQQGNREFALKAKEQEAVILIGAANIYRKLNNRQKSIESLIKSVQINESLPNREKEVAFLCFAIGNEYHSDFDFKNALDWLIKGLGIVEKLGNKESETAILGILGLIYEDTNNTTKATEIWQRQLDVMLSPQYDLSVKKNKGTVKDKSLENYAARLSEIQKLLGIANTYKKLKQYEKALEYYNKVLSITRSSNQSSDINLVLALIGNLYLEKEDWTNGERFYQQAADLSRNFSEKSVFASNLSNLAYAKLNAKKLQAALRDAEQSLLIYQSLKPTENLQRGYATNLNFLSRIHNELGNRKLAIFYGKQAVNAIQREREKLQNLDQESQRGYLKNNEKPYRRLADWLIAEGNFAEAEQVLRMLKEEEFSDFVRRDADEIKNLNAQLKFEGKEKEIIERYNLLADEVSRIGQKFYELDDKKRQLSGKKLSLSADEQKQYEELEKQLKVANDAFQLFLDKELVKEFSEKKKGEIEVQYSKQEELRNLGKGAVLLYTVVGEDRYRVILTTPDFRVDGKYEIKAEELNAKVFAFRNALQNPKIDPRPLGKELYDILIKPIEKDLKNVGAKTLVWSLDGTLRYLPLAALSPDGKKYLVEDFQNVVFTTKTGLDGASLTTNWRALGFGVSTKQTVSNPEDPQGQLNFPALLGTKSELLSIVKNENSKNERGVMFGKRFLDNEFTTSALKESLIQQNADGKRRYNIVHFASHFYLGNNLYNSFLLIGNGQILRLGDLKNSNIKFGGVDLVTLSACNTAFAKNANGVEVDSLAEIIQSQGGKSVLATLWSVADESTSLLMSEFYRLRKDNPNLTKADAMQIAQQAMISGKLKSSGTESGCRSELVNLDGTQQTAFKCDKDAPFSHPYFWSPFVLIGNWR